VHGQLEAVERRLADANFTDRAPAHVVDDARRRAAELREQSAALRARLDES
jgi:valyl-tRNA synthetase